MASAQLVNGRPILKAHWKETVKDIQRLSQIHKQLIRKKPFQIDHLQEGVWSVKKRIWRFHWLTNCIQLYPIVTSRFDQRDFDLFILNFLGLARFGPSFQAKSCALTRPAFYHTIGGVGHGFHQHEVDLWVWSGLQIWSVTEIVWHILRSDERYLLTHVGCLCHVSLLDDVRCHLGQNPRPVWAHCSDSSPCFERFISHGYLWSKNSWKFNAVFLI